MVQHCSIVIPEPELRGITIRQLENICRQIKLRCVKEKWERSKDGVKTCLQPEEVNLYDLNSNFIIPQTSASKCSYVELIAPGPQQPRWFVSHWWGEPVLDFVACIEQHAFDRDLDKNTAYWVCAYANNQHDLANEVGVSDLTQSSFFKALRLSKGVLSIADRDSVVFSRIWCTFEIFLALDNSAHKDKGVQENSRQRSCLYDIYTRSKRGGIGLTDGVVAADKYPRNDDGKTLNTRAVPFEGNYNGMRTIRQANFPSIVCEKALSINLETAEASVELDRKRILNFIAKSENMDGEPPTTHENFTYINSILRSKFATAAYRRCLEEKRDVEKIRKVLSESQIEDLQLSFHGTRQFKEEAKKFTKSLPTTLKQLDLKFTMQLFETSKEFAIGFERLKKLESFKLDCSTCTLTSCTDLWKEIEKLNNLRVLDLKFSYNKHMQSIEGLGEAIADLSKLQVLKLDFSLSGLSKRSVMEFCNKLAQADLKVNQLSLNFDPVIDLHSVNNTYSLTQTLRESNSCCENCIVM